MTAEALIERTVISIKTAYTSNIGIDNLFVYNVLDSVRESVLFNRNTKGDKTVPSQIQQFSLLYYDAAIQPLNNDGSFTIYNIPRLAQVGAGITAPINVMKTKGIAYPLYTSLQLYETMKRNSYIKSKQDVVVLVNNGYEDQLYLYGERKNKLRCQAVFASPLELDTYNPTTDEYPITGNFAAEMEQQILQLYMRSLQMSAPRYVKEEVGVK